MSLKPISPAEARRLMEAGAVFIDIRDRDEFARMHIPGSRNIPLDQFEGQNMPHDDLSPFVFHCQSGARTSSHGERLSAGLSCAAYMIEGGIDAWSKSGQPVARDRKAPLPIMRQVQIIAGLLVLAGAVLGAAVDPWFHVVSGLVGAGLMMAGITGWCGMARLLALMPWNRRRNGTNPAAAAGS